MNKTTKLFQFEMSRKLGEGSFGEVILGIKNGQNYAIKKLSKKQIIKVNKFHQPFIQKEILYKMNDHCKNQPFFIKIYETESDEDNIYLVLEFCSGGTLQDFVLTNNLKIGTIRRLAAKILLIMQKLHSFNVVHRDLKPSNILLSEDGFLKLSDFGTAYAPDQFFTTQMAAKIRDIKQMSFKNNQEKQRKNSQSSESTQDRRSTFVGTACYMAPELLSNDTCGKQADIWAYGCILFEMIFKRSPFFDVSEGMVWKKILNDEIAIEPTASMKESEEFQQYCLIIDLIKKILVKEIQKRLGFGQKGYSELKLHPFFEGIDWESEVYKPIGQIVSILQNKKIQEQPEKQVEKVIFSGVVGKKAFFGNFKERMLILYSSPKLVYYCTETGDKKGQINLEKQTPIAVDGKVFSVANQKKTYYFKSKTSNQWSEMIRNSILNAYY